MNLPIASPAPREEWTNKKTYWLTQIGSAVGLGNIWRFPYLAFKNGGGGFLIPYAVCLLTLGMPLFLLELSFGQLYRKGIVSTTKQVHPRATGIGLFHIWTTFLILSYYCTLLTWILHYFVVSFYAVLPFANGHAESYFMKEFLQVDKGAFASELNGPLIGYLCLVWTMIFLVVMRGVKGTEKVSWVLMPTCFVLFLCLFVRGILLEGASMGIFYYFAPDFSKLLQPSTWLDAAGQIFFSIGLAGGVIPALASYTSKLQDPVVDMFLITLSNASFEIFAGFVVFSYLGHLSFLTKTHVSVVASSGPALAFVVFPTALSTMPWANVFCVVFFGVLLLLGVTSAYVMVQSIVTSAKDSFPRFKTSAIALAVCLLGLASGLLYTSNYGYFLVEVVDHYTSLMLLIGGLLECLFVIVNRVQGTVSEESAKKPFCYFLPNGSTASFSHQSGSIFLVEYLRKSLNRFTRIPIPRLWVALLSVFIPLVVVVMIFSTLILSPSYGGFPLEIQVMFGWIPLFVGALMVLIPAISYSRVNRRCFEMPSWTFRWRRGREREEEFVMLEERKK